MEELVFTVTFWDKETNEWKGSTSGFETEHEARIYSNTRRCYNATISKEEINLWSDENETFN